MQARPHHASPRAKGSLPHNSCLSLAEGCSQGGERRKALAPSTCARTSRLGARILLWTEKPRGREVQEATCSQPLGWTVGVAWATDNICYSCCQRHHRRQRQHHHHLHHHLHQTPKHHGKHRPSTSHKNELKMAHRPKCKMQS